jgi:penicillin amidase|tara:strand:+ start:13105 stop:15519 length:2415 start_codon:yes stop_codon:yes gene_type:complete
MNSMRWVTGVLTVLLVQASAAAEEITVGGLQQGVEILTDRWGVAHIYAENEHDLFFAQGYNAAKDRLFQFEMWRRQATGTVAELLGPRELQRDIGTRLHLFRKNLSQELNHYHPRGEQIVNAFVDGVNAYIRRTEAEPALLPVEFEVLGIKPGRWTPAVVISRHQGLLSNATTELRLGRAVALVGASVVKDLQWFRPGDPVMQLDAAIDGSLLVPEILNLYRAFRRRIQFKAEDIVAEFRGDSSLRLLARSHDEAIADGYGGDGTGSNNWVVSGRFTQSGYPYIVNDPHRSVALPSLRYFVHLHAPGWNVIGGGEPVLPGVSIGHNEHGGWGLTVFGQDNEDLYVYDTNPANPSQYRYLDRWEEMRVISDTIAVKGESPRAVELKYTRHGPVLHEDEKNHKAYALRAAWLEIGNAPYLASLRMDQASSWQEFVEACSYSGIPSENMIWGDVDKNIGYQAVGISPIRPNWSGLVPVPGDGRYEWDGYLPIKALPHILNPDKGYFASANNYMVPEGYPHENALHYTWGDEMRGLRADELLSNGRRHTIVDMMNYQHDELAIPARNIVPLLRPIDFDDGRMKSAVARLLDWDFVLDKGSAAATIYVSFERQLARNMQQLLVPEAAGGVLVRLNKKRIIDWLVAPDGRFGDDPIQARDALLVDSLQQALTDLTERLGPNMNEWHYGQEKFKHVLIRHPLSEVVGNDLRRRLDVGPAARGGYEATLNSTGASNNQRSGATFRVIMDSANWDNSVATSAPGQSGDPDSPHYRDLFQLWVKHQYFPIFFSREKIESVTEQRAWLTPRATSR